MPPGASRAAQIDSVVFDIGRVLVQLEFAHFLRFLAEYGADTDSIDLMLERIDLVGYERGEFGGDELLRRVASLGSVEMPMDALREQWLGVFVPVWSMIALAREVSRTRRVFLLSNIGDLHWDFLERSIGVNSIGHGALPSFQAGACKPDAAIYRKAEELFGLDPARTVFIDDLARNVDAARQRGWRAIHHLDAATTVADLRSLGVVP